MAKWVPFTAHIRIVPQWGSGELKGKRMEMWRDMERIAALAYDAIAAETSFQVATPGGGQSCLRGGQEGGSWSGYRHGTAAKPRIGQSPAQLMITGFYDSASPNSQQHPDQTVFHGGEIVTGAGGAAACIQNPATTNRTDEQAILGLLESALTTGLPSDVPWSVYRLEVAGVIYGDKGYHL